MESCASSTDIGTHHASRAAARKGKTMNFVGIDWADQTHRLCILGDEGQRLESFEIAHGRKGFEAAHSRIARHGTPDATRIAIETKDSLLVDFLVELGYALYFVNPKQTDRFRDRHRMSRSKSDAFDAFVLADAVRTDHQLFNALSPLDETSLQLRVLTRSREGLVGRKVAVHNEITSHLKRYFPVASGLFGGLDNAAAIAFLLQYPTLEQAKTVSQARITALLIKEARVTPAIAVRHATRARALLSEPQAAASSSVTRAYPVAVQSLLRQLKSILAELEALDREIASIYDHHPNKELLQSLPGVAETLGPVLAAELGTDVTRFVNLRGLKAFAGTSPVTVQSGKHRSVHIRRACNQHLRQALHMASLVAVRIAPWARELFDRLRNEGKTYGRALRAVGEQLLEILYVLLTRRTRYDEG